MRGQLLLNPAQICCFLQIAVGLIFPAHYQLIIRVNPVLDNDLAILYACACTVLHSAK